MKAKQRKRARELRENGFSLREIVVKTGFAKGSVSNWIRDITLTDKQIARFKSNQDRGRAKAANHPNSPKQVWGNIRKQIMESSEREIPEAYSDLLLKVIGSSLYWAEGYKAAVNMVSFSNSDPKMIALMMKFFRDICRVPNGKFRGVIHIHPHLDRAKAEKFWVAVSGIPISQFHKTQFGVSRASKQKRDTLPLGTFSIIICDTRLQSRIKGWIVGVAKWVSSRAVGAIG